MSDAADVIRETQALLKGTPLAELGWPALMRQEAFYGLPGEFVSLVEPHTEADRHGLLIQLLAAAGNMIGRGPGLMADGAFHSTIVWPVLIGASAKARKGTAWSSGARAARAGRPRVGLHEDRRWALDG